MVDLLNTRIFERFPNLKFALSEGGIGWMPYILERTDYIWERHRFYTGMDEARRPSEIAESLAHLPDDVCRRIAEDDARRVFNFPRVG